MNRMAGETDSGRTVQIQTESVVLEGKLHLPEAARGIVVFVHGSGSSRNSPRNQYVADVIRESGLGTLLFDLLTADEERIDMVTHHLRFDIGMLARRTVGATDWLLRQPYGQGLRIGYFGSSTGAAAALIAAAERVGSTGAVVSRGGRPDMADSVLPLVQAPSLFIVGGEDSPVIQLNRQAISQMAEDTERRLEIVPGAGHLFEEPSTLETVAELARDWFERYLPSSNQAAG